MAETRERTETLSLICNFRSGLTLPEIIQKATSIDRVADPYRAPFKDQAQIVQTVFQHTDKPGLLFLSCTRALETRFSLVNMKEAIWIKHIFNEYRFLPEIIQLLQLKTEQSIQESISMLKALIERYYSHIDIYNELVKNDFNISKLIRGNIITGNYFREIQYFIMEWLESLNGDFTPEIIGDLLKEELVEFHEAWKALTDYSARRITKDHIPDNQHKTLMLNFSMEAADILIYLIQYCKLSGLDLETEIRKISLLDLSKAYDIPLKEAILNMIGSRLL